MTNLKISTFVLKRLKNLANGKSGTIYAVERGESVFAIALIIARSNKVNHGGDFKEFEVNMGITISQTFPIEMYCSSAEENAARKSPWVIRVDPDNKDVIATFEGKLIEWTELTKENVASGFFVARIRAALPFSCEMSEDGVLRGANHLLDKVDRFITPELHELDPDVQFFGCDNKKMYKRMRDLDIVNFSILRNLSAKDGCEQDRAVLIDYVTFDKKCIKFNLNIDSVALMPKDATAGDITFWIGESLKQNVTLISDCLVKQIRSGAQLSIPQIFHFLPENCGHFMSVAYPKKELDRDLGDERAILHEAFQLPMDRPLLMRGNAFNFEPDTKTGELENPHLAVGESGIVGGEPALLQGRYTYHHYCQGGESDDGWGCAYRSLQTLCSWFRLQGYTNRNIPTLKEIQQCLVSIGDKPSSFVGSRQWIGSSEVGFCLDTLLGVTARIVSVSSGEEMGMKGGELTHHFKTQGTPVMIGGGNLAHTILGVDYNKKTGDIKFLILDPHFKGADDLSVIISKQWCGWKGLDFWKKGSFYNMCMPIRPKCI